MIKQGIVALLGGTSAVTALIGDRLYPVKVPDEQSIYPCATYQEISGRRPEWTLGKRQSNFMTLQIDAYGPSYANNDAVLGAISDVLNGFVGTLSGGARIIFAENSNGVDHFEDNARVYRSISEYDIEYVEPNH